VVDTPGFGDFINNDESWDPIVKNIEQRFDAYLDAENKVNRMNIVDNRIHAVVYFIQPTGHSLKPIDIEVMKKLHTKVNLIPVIAKADTVTDDEIDNYKKRVCCFFCLPPFWILLTNTDSCRYRLPQDPDLRGTTV
jgi:septin 7